MNTYDENYFKGLAEDLMFELTTEEATAIKNEFAILQKQLELLAEINTEGVEEMIYPFEQPTTFMRDDVKQLELLAEINTEGVEEMIYPFEQPTTFMRDDVVEDALTVDETLSNAKRRRKEYIVLPRVVK